MGIMTAAALPTMNSCRRIGVVSNGSSVPCSRSPTTEYAARVLGMMTGIKSRSRRGSVRLLSRCRSRCGRRSEEDGDDRLEEKEERQDGHRHDDGPFAPVVPQLLADDGADAGGIETHHCLRASTSSSISSRYTSSSECCASPMERTSAPAPTRRACHLGCGSPGIGHREHVGARIIGAPALDTRGSRRRAGRGCRAARAVLTTSAVLNSCSRELLGPADGSQGRVQDGDPVAELLGFFEPVGGEKDRHSLLPEPVDQVVYLAGSHRVETRRRLVEEHDLRVAQHRSRQSHPLAEPLGETAAEISRTIAEIDRVEGVSDPRPGLMQTVEIGEELQVLGHGQAQIEPRRLGHDRDALADLHSVLRAERDPRDGRRARGRRDQRAESTHRGGLACAVRTQEPEHLTVGDFERHVGEGGPLAEALGQLLDDKGGLALHTVERRPIGAGFDVSRLVEEGHSGAPSGGGRVAGGNAGTPQDGLRVADRERGTR